MTTKCFGFPFYAIFRWFQKEIRKIYLSLSFKYHLDIYFIQYKVVLDCQITVFAGP